MTFVWIGAAALMLFNVVYVVAKIRSDVAGSRQVWAAVGIIGLMGTVLAFGAIKVAAYHAFDDHLEEIMKDF
jgi:hypothetical protein